MATIDPDIPDVLRRTERLQKAAEAIYSLDDTDALVASLERRAMDLSAELEIERNARKAAEARAARLSRECRAWAIAACMLGLGAMLAIVNAM